MALSNVDGVAFGDDDVVRKLLLRINQAERKHPHSGWRDGTSVHSRALHEFQGASMNADLKQTQEILAVMEGRGDATWLQILLCEVHELASEMADDRIVDELLDVMSVCARWIKAKQRKVVT